MTKKYILKRQKNKEKIQHIIMYDKKLSFLLIPKGIFFLCLWEKSIMMMGNTNIFGDLWHHFSCVDGLDNELFTLYCVPSKETMSIIRIRLRKVIKCLGLNDFSQANSNNSHWVSFGGTQYSIRRFVIFSGKSH
jgi:hypothetical protein